MRLTPLADLPLGLVARRLQRRDDIARLTHVDQHRIAQRALPGG